jgi:hypothetical protein
MNLNIVIIMINPIRKNASHKKKNYPISESNRLCCFETNYHLIIVKIVLSQFLNITKKKTIHTVRCKEKRPEMSFKKVIRLHKRQMTISVGQ